MILRIDRLAIELPVPENPSPNLVDDPVAREMVGYLLIRGGVHIVAYARR